MKKRSKIFKEIIWLFIIGCFIGFILETVWYFLKNGILINKQGLLYGLFKPIYGFGIIIITCLFYKVQNKNSFIIFIVGILIGSIYEYATSIFQEFILGTSTWDYSTFNFNLNGRIYLPYCIGWGIITLLYIKFLFPKFKELIEKIPLWFSVIAAVFMISNLLISAIAVYQYSNRMNNIKHDIPVLKFIDEVYDDEVIRKKFPKLKVIKK